MEVRVDVGEKLGGLLLKFGPADGVMRELLLKPDPTEGMEPRNGLGAGFGRRDLVWRRRARLLLGAGGLPRDQAKASAAVGATPVMLAPVLSGFVES